MSQFIFSQYADKVYNGLASLADANLKYEQENGALVVDEELRPLILQHKLEHLFGISLVHRHFQLRPGTFLVENNMISCPWSSTSSKKLGGSIAPASWVSQAGFVYPYEFTFIGYGEEVPPDLTGYQSFVRDFFDIVQKHNLGDVLGLRRIPGHGYEDVLEFTEGMANINLRRSEVGPDCWDRDTTDTMWFFDGKPPYKTYRCVCTNTGSEVNPNHNHIDQP